MSTLFDIIVGISHSKCQIVDKEQHGCMRYTKHLEMLPMFTELPLELELTILYQSEGVLAAPYKTGKGKCLSIPSKVCQ